jgi:hypothetical protein
MTMMRAEPPDGIYNVPEILDMDYFHKNLREYDYGYYRLRDKHGTVVSVLAMLHHWDQPKYGPITKDVSDAMDRMCADIRRWRIDNPNANREVAEANVWWNSTEWSSRSYGGRHLKIGSPEYWDYHNETQTIRRQYLDSHQSLVDEEVKRLLSV